MIEMRREKRWPASLSLEVTSLYKQDNDKVEGLSEPILITDVSKAGIGFKSNASLPEGYYFNAALTLSKGETLKCVVHIIRKMDLEDGFHYGCEIVGAASIMDYVINDYAASLESE
ncbi:MAG: PilZ domain-containing protein [Eubacterium sp.]|nr:PilZ domain-containing protein [Eubacterium sp.]